MSDTVHATAVVVIGRLVPEYRSRAESIASELTAAEKQEISAAGDDKANGRSLVKAVLSKAMERREREAAAAMPGQLQQDAEFAASLRSGAATEPDSGEVIDDSAEVAGDEPPAEDVAEEVADEAPAEETPAVSPRRVRK